jgi:DNA repair exonuclease SbcCD ATPase subunit
MKITRFYEQNYGPFSNELIDIPISDDPELIQLLGSNGHGKSTLLRGFSVAGYGETSGITASDIANSINGKCITGICTEIKGVPWRIERGFSPNFVKVYRGDNTKPEDFGGIDATKNKIKKEIMDVPYYIFSSILSLSINDFKSFMTMQPKDSKNIRDRIFGFYVLNEMYDRVNKE